MPEFSSNSAKPFQKRCLFCDNLKDFFRIPYSLVARLYRLIFARPSMQFLNNIILQLALNGRGFNNCCDLKTSGEANFLEILRKHNPKICVDIGANKGEYSRFILEKTNSNVIAFEPLPCVFEDLVTLKSKFPDRFNIINKGVGDCEGVFQLFFGEKSYLASFSKEASSIGYVGDNNTKSIQVEVITLDGYFSQNFENEIDELDLLKIDTEGFEYEVLIGAEITIRRLRPKFIQIEYNWHQMFKSHSLYKISSLLSGYNVYQILPYGSGLNLIDPSRPESNIFHYSNFVFVRGDIII